MKKGRAALMMFALAGSMAAQQPAEEKKLSFEVVSIRRAAPSPFPGNRFSVYFWIAATASSVPTCGSGMAPALTIGNRSMTTILRLPAVKAVTFDRGLLLQGVTMYNVAEILSLPQGRNQLGTIVTDHTGLKGRYDMRLEFTFPPPGGPPSVVAPSLESAIREQWGLKIEKASGPFRLVTIESAEHPTEN
jgi:hypothetical protein